MNTNFYLYAAKKPASTPRSVYLVCRLKGRQLRYNTGIRVIASQWDSKKMRVTAHHERNTLNNKLAELAAIAREYEEKLPLTVKPTQESFKNFFWVKLKMIEEGKTFFAVVNNVLDDLPTRENRNHEVITEKSMKKYKLVAEALHKFEEEKRKVHKGFQLDFKTFDGKLIKEFDWYLSEGKDKADTKRGIKPRAHNTVVRYLEILFHFFCEAKRKGIDICEDFQDYDNHKIRPQNVTITDEEFEQIYCHKASNERLENVRQLFIISCTTGLRYSDLETLQAKHINFSDEVIQRIQHKTNMSVDIALHPLLGKMLQQNNNMLPKPICNQDFNRYLKELFKEIGLDRNVQISRTVGKKREIVDYKLYEIASSKMGRRYLCSSLYGKVPERTIMAMSGHHSTSAFHAYLCNTQNQEREAVMNIWEQQYSHLLHDTLQPTKEQLISLYEKRLLEDDDLMQPSSASFL